MGQHDLDSLRDYPIVKFFGRQQSRRVIHVCCPFHKEKTPSLALYADNSYHCFGCGKYGRGSIDFVMHLGDVSFKEACDELERMV